ncbi:hypothetical protein [Microbacterium lacticum]|uniref:hypothetical protein n=1 Tax=Microbacterium lacticum TaxID=33885 RepID=UPI001476FDB7|nr:hypothetical protein [Microbacterium lacticum]
MHFTGDAAADELLRDNPLALAFGMLLDRHIAMQRSDLRPSVIAKEDPAISTD